MVRRRCAQIAVECSNLFLRHYVRRDVHLMAVQTLLPDGSVSGSIPATPDADPGYHTGLSAIDSDGHWGWLLKGGS